MAKVLCPTDAERSLAAACQRKQQAGQTPTQLEQRAYKKVSAYNEEQARWRFYRSLPKGHYCTLSGRQQKTIDQQAGLYGLPLLGPTLDLQQVLTAFHDLLAEHGEKFLPADETLDAGDSPALEKWRHEKWLLARIERRQKEKDLVPRDVLHNYLQNIGNQLREVGEFLQRNYGPDALDHWNDKLDTIEKNVTELIQGLETTPEEQPDAPAECLGDV